MALENFTRLEANTNTFSDWLNKTNEIVDLVSLDIITANGSIANTGGGLFGGDRFARLIGGFSTNTVYAEVISGGDIEAVNDLAIVSNTLFSNSSVEIDNQLSVSANVAVDTNVLFVDTVNNRVGVGTSTPSQLLTVNGRAQITHLDVSANVAVDTDVLFVDSVNNRVGVNTSTPTAPLTVNGAAVVSATLTVSSNTIIDTNVVFVNTVTDRVGIMKAPTQGQLDVNGSIYANNLFISQDTNLNSLTVTGVANIALLDVSGLQANGISLTGTSFSVTSTAPTVIDSFPKSVTRGLKYIIQAHANGASTSAYTLEILCAHNNTNTFFTRFAELKNDFEAVLAPQINGANVDLVATCPSASVSNNHIFNIIKLGTGA